MKIKMTPFREIKYNPKRNQSKNLVSVHLKKETPTLNKFVMSTDSIKTHQIS